MHQICLYSCRNHCRLFVCIRNTSVFSVLRNVWRNMLRWAMKWICNVVSYNPAIRSAFNDWHTDRQTGPWVLRLNISQRTIQSGSTRTSQDRQIVNAFWRHLVSVGRFHSPKIFFTVLRGRFKKHRLGTFRKLKRRSFTGGTEAIFYSTKSKG